MKLGCLFSLIALLITGLVVAFVVPQIVSDPGRIKPVSRAIGQAAFWVICLPAFFIGWHIQRKQKKKSINIPAA